MVEEGKARCVRHRTDCAERSLQAARMNKPAIKTLSGSLRVRAGKRVAEQRTSTEPANKSERVVVEGFRLGRIPPRDRNAFARLLRKQRLQAKKALRTTTL